MFHILNFIYITLTPCICQNFSGVEVTAKCSKTLGMESIVSQLASPTFPNTDNEITVSIIGLTHCWATTQLYSRVRSICSAINLGMLQTPMPSVAQ